jgi:glycosyltransferase involved in cell wall biosynthesis
MKTETRTMSVVVVSHACVVDVNQEPFLALASRGVRVRVIAPEALRTDIRGTIRFGALDGLDTVALPVRTGGYGPRLKQAGVHLISYKQLAGAVASAQPSLLYAEEEPWSMTTWQVARLARRLGVPFAFHQSQNVAKRLPPPFEKMRRSILKRAAGATVRLEGPARILRDQGFDKPLLSIPNVVDPARFDAAPSYTDLPKPVLGFVGRLVHSKGVLAFLRASAAAIGAKGSVLVAGDGPLAYEARRLSSALGLNATFTGPVAHGEIGGVFASMDVCAVPSRTTKGWKEQFGRVVVEANAAGVPVVVTECGELPATVRATGGGIVVGENDDAALAEALGRLAKDKRLRTQLGETGRRNARERFTPEAVAADLDGFFRKLVDTE